MTELKPLHSIQEPLEVGLKVVAAIYLGIVVMTPIAYAQYSKLPADAKYLDTFLWSDNVMMVLELLAVVAGLGTIVMFLMWVYRATKNLRTLTAYPMSQTPGWAVGWYFVPIALWFKPYHGIVDIWRAAGVSGGTAVRAIWWLTFIGTSFLGGVLDTSDVDVTVREAQKFVVPDMVTAASAIVVALLTLAVVSRIGRAYSLNITEWQAQPPPTPAGWHDDPSGTGSLRYWDGSQWTDAVHSREDDQDSGSS